MRPRFLLALAPIVLVLAGLTAPASAAPALRLTRWAGPAELVPSYAPGIEYYRLMARLHRERGATVVGTFAMSVDLPGGRTETRPIRQHELDAGWLPVLVPSSSVRNLRPAAVVVQASVRDPATGKAVSNVMTATIADFPHPAPGRGTVDPGPFGWGEPLAAGPDAPRLLPRPGPDGFRFVRIPPSEGVPACFVAIQEASNAQVTKRLSGYDPKAGRSDEFALEDPAQPALGLSPHQAEQYLAELGQADPSGVSYRLPRQAEWLRAARAGKDTAFWWGDEPTDPAGANFLGPEPALANDSTAPALTADPDSGRGFAANPWGLFHTFGNVAEWASTPAGGFVRLGGHFRTEPAVPLPEVPGDKPDTPGPDPYVGVRPAFDLDAAAGAALIRRVLKGNALLADLGVTYDPELGMAILTGTLPEPRLRRAADRRLEPLWFLAAVENRIVTPRLVPGQLATLGALAGAVRRITPLGRWVYEVPVAVRWADPLPVRGSEWWVNIYLAGGGHFAHKLVEIEPDPSGRVIVLVDRARLAAAGLPANALVSVALSLGAEAPGPADPHVVSNVVPLRWSLP